MATHSIPGYVLFLLFVLFFVIGPTLIGSWLGGFRLRNIDRQNPYYIFTLLIAIFVGVIVAAVLAQTHILSGRYVY